MVSDRKIAKGAAHRTSISAADTTADISSATGALDITANLHVACVAECSVASTTGTVFLSLFDDDGNFLGITESQTFLADAVYRNGAAGSFVAPTLLFDVMGAGKVKALVGSLSGGNIDSLWLIPLTLDS